jgi:hypothetical protein
VSQSGTNDTFRRATQDSSIFRPDFLSFSAPFGVVGSSREHFLPRRYLIKFLQARSMVIRRVTESLTEEWRQYLS